MRVWLDPDRLASRQLTTSDVVRAIREQNVQVAAGVLGAPPAPSDATFQLSINTQGRLTTEEEFGDIIVRATADGQITRLSDVARLELGSSRYSLRSLLDNKPAVAHRHLSAARHQRAAGLRRRARDDGAAEARLPRRRRLPHRLRPDRVRPRVDQRGRRTRCSRRSCWWSSWWSSSCRPGAPRSSRWSPCPVSLVGTFAVMLGARLLAQHAVAVRPGAGHRHRRRRCHRGGRERGAAHRAGQSPMEATRRAMEEVSGPIIAIALVLARGVRADGVHQRPDRSVLPPVRADDRDLDGHLGVQLADAEPGAGVAPAAAARRAARRAATGHRLRCSAGSSAASTARSAAGRRSMPVACLACCACRRWRWCSTSS